MQRRTYLTAVAAGLIAATTSLAACSTPSVDTPATSNPPKQSGIVIGSMIWNTSVPFYSNFIKGQQEEAAKLGVTLKLVDGKGDLGTQVSAVQQLITQKVDAILVTASDPKGIAPIVGQATAAGIPVFAVNNRVDDSAKVVTFIGADDVVFGQQQAKLVAQTLGDKGKVAYMMGELGTSAQLLRKQGFDKEMANHPGISVIDSQTSNWDAAKALSVTQDWLNKYPAGALDAIVAQGPEAANAAKYAHDNGRTDLKFVLGDYPVEVRDGIIAGYITGTVDQDPKPQGVRSVEAAVEWVKGQKDKVTQPNEYLDLPIVTKANVNDFPAAWGN